MIATMTMVSVSRMANTGWSDDPGADFQKNNSLVLATGSLLLGGMVTDKIGAFVPLANDP
jgi:UPF0716 family protein affecting phage T7 exclusion